MQVIDITDRLFTVSEREELSTLLRKVAKVSDWADEETQDMHIRIRHLMKKAGGPEKFFKNTPMNIKDIIY